MPKPEYQNAEPGGFVICYWEFFRHWTFVLRHFASGNRIGPMRTADASRQHGERFPSHFAFAQMLHAVLQFAFHELAEREGKVNLSIGPGDCDAKRLRCAAGAAAGAGALDGQLSVN